MRTELAPIQHIEYRQTPVASHSFISSNINEVAIQYGSFITESYGDEQLPLEEQVKSIAAAREIVTMHIGDKLVGLTAYDKCTRESDPNLFSNLPDSVNLILHIREKAVAPQFQGNGISRKLHEALLNELGQHPDAVLGETLTVASATARMKGLKPHQLDVDPQYLTYWAGIPQNVEEPPGSQNNHLVETLSQNYIYNFYPHEKNLYSDGIRPSTLFTRSATYQPSNNLQLNQAQAKLVNTQQYIEEEYGQVVPISGLLISVKSDIIPTNL